MTYSEKTGLNIYNIWSPNCIKYIEVSFTSTFREMFCCKYLILFIGFIFLNSYILNLLIYHNKRPPPQSHGILCRLFTHLSMISVELLNENKIETNSQFKIKNFLTFQYWVNYDETAAVSCKCCWKLRPTSLLIPWAYR